MLRLLERLLAWFGFRLARKVRVPVKLHIKVE